jgi:hypothetical protein
LVDDPFELLGPVIVVPVVVDVFVPVTADEPVCGVVVSPCLVGSLTSPEPGWVTRDLAPLSACSSGDDEGVGEDVGDDVVGEASATHLGDGIGVGVGDGVVPETS